MTMTIPGPRSEVDLAQALGQITHAARVLVPGVEHASVSLRHTDQRLETVAPSDPITLQADQLQLELHEGPCYDGGLTQGASRYAKNLASEARWPSYGPKAAALGFHAQLVIALYDEGEAWAGLNLYAIEAGALDDSMDAAVALADLARATIQHSRAYSTLVAALRTREMIGEAVGLTMERYDIDADRAFDYLVRQSQTSNTKLREIAAGLVSAKLKATGEAGAARSIS